MSLSTSIELAASGLRATQAGLDVVAQNVANSGTVGYTRRVLDSEQRVAGGRTIGVDVTGASRTLNTIVQRQLRLEQAGAAYSSTRSAGHSALQAIFDKAGGTGSLPTLLDTFASKLQSLANDPSASIGQAEVLSAASDLAGSLNGLSGQVASMRQNAETAIGQSVKTADGLLGQIAALNGTIVRDPASAALQDRRDALIDQLSTLLDVKVTQSASGSVTVSTTGGLQLVDGVTQTHLSFDEHALGPTSIYDPDPARRGVGTITATDDSGATRDVIASGLIRSGEIAAQIEMRDIVLPQAQAQLDGLAAGLASTLSDRTVGGAAASSGPATGFDLDLSSLAAGNSLSVTVRDPGGASRTLTFVKATSAAGVAAAAAAGQVAIDLSGGLAGAVSRIATALGSAYSVSNPSGATLRILNDGTTSAVTSLDAKATVSGLATGSPELPLFTDSAQGGRLYTGSYEAGAQLTGFAARIAVNPAVTADRSSLIGYASSTPAGDTTRPLLLLDRLTNTSRTFSGAAGIGGSDAPWTGSVVGFATQIVATQASDANAASNLDAGQQVVLNSVQSRFADGAGVNIDSELTQLIQLQTAYGANARVLTAVKELMDMLMRISV